MVTLNKLSMYNQHVLLYNLRSKFENWIGKQKKERVVTTNSPREINMYFIENSLAKFENWIGKQKKERVVTL